MTLIALTMIVTINETIVKTNITTISFVSFPAHIPVQLHFRVPFPNSSVPAFRWWRRPRAPARSTMASFAAGPLFHKGFKFGVRRSSFSGSPLHMRIAYASLEDNRPGKHKTQDTRHKRQYVVSSPQNRLMIFHSGPRHLPRIK